jgi:sigma-B regulation protein RsbU (phosphoserine phosphatase)
VNNIADQTIVLESILVTQQPVFVKMAEGWTSRGATFFSVCNGSRVLASWPKQVEAQKADLVAPIYLDQTYLGELQIGGISSDVAGHLLQLEVSLINAMLQQEQALNVVAAALVDARDQLWALHRLTHRTRSYLDMDEMLQTLIGESADLMRTKSAFIWLELEGGQSLFCQYPEPLLQNDDIVRYRAELAATDVDFLCHHRVTDHPAIDDILIVPVEIRVAKTAVMGMMNKVGGAFTTPDIKLAKAIAEYAGAQVENLISYQDSLEKARLRHEMDLAHRVQLQLFPQALPKMADMDFWATSESASHVGGDFYDYYVHANGRLTFVVGDVSGKGIASALLMAMTRTILRTRMQTLPVLTPGQIIEQANFELYDDFTRVNMFATVFVGQYDPVTRRLVYANSGHSPVIYYSLNNQPMLLEADSVPMGILPRISTSEQAILLSPNELLITGSDGLYEAHNEQGELFGFERLVRAISSLRHCTAQEIGEKAIELIASFSAGHLQEDDRTILILKPTG